MRAVKGTDKQQLSGNSLINAGSDVVMKGGSRILHVHHMSLEICLGCCKHSEGEGYKQIALFSDAEWLT